MQAQIWASFYEPVQNGKGQVNGNFVSLETVSYLRSFCYFLDQRPDGPVFYWSKQKQNKVQELGIPALQEEQHIRNEIHPEKLNKNKKKKPKRALCSESSGATSEDSNRSTQLRAHFERSTPNTEYATSNIEVDTSIQEHRSGTKDRNWCHKFRDKLGYYKLED